MRILFVTRQFDGVMGGLERQIATIAQALVKSGIQVHLLFLSDSTSHPYYELPREVKIHRVGPQNPSNSISLWEKVQRQRKIFKVVKEFNPDLCVAFMTGGFYLVRLSTWILRIPCILSERNSPSMLSITNLGWKRHLIFQAMRFADIITVQFESYQQKYPSYLRKKIITIPNSISEDLNQEFRSTDRKKVVFLFAGRFSFQKQPLMLIESFGKFASNRPDVELQIYGNGELASEVSSTIAQSRVKNRIKLNDATPDLESVFHKADITCVTSLWEGFPNTALESLYYGTPVLGFKSCDGIPELVEDGINGWLVVGECTVENLTKGLERAYLDIKSDKIDFASVSESVRKYSELEVTKKWLELFQNITNCATFLKI